jgi:hypothetical protein
MYGPRMEFCEIRFVVGGIESDTMIIGVRVRDTLTTTT